MASVIYGKYIIDYSILDGRVTDFNKMDEKDNVIKASEEELIKISERILSDGGRNRYAFINKLIDDGKISE